jgi:hypothetical protein
MNAWLWILVALGGWTAIDLIALLLLRLAAWLYTRHQIDDGPSATIIEFPVRNNGEGHAA